MIKAGAGFGPRMAFPRGAGVFHFNAFPADAQGQGIKKKPIKDFIKQMLRGLEPIEKCLAQLAVPQSYGFTNGV